MSGARSAADYINDSYCCCVRGWVVIPDARSNEWERDLRLDYVLQEGSLKGLGFSLRNASLRGNVGADVDENRLYVTYSLPLL